MTCDKCDGTGEIQFGGMIVMECPECNGTGSKEESK